MQHKICWFNHVFEYTAQRHEAVAPLYDPHHHPSPEHLHLPKLELSPLTIAPLSWPPSLSPPTSSWQPLFHFLSLWVDYFGYLYKYKGLWTRAVWLISKQDKRYRSCNSREQLRALEHSGRKRIPLHPSVFLPGLGLKSFWGACGCHKIMKPTSGREICHKLGKGLDFQVAKKVTRRIGRLESVSRSRLVWKTSWILSQ